MVNAFSLFALITGVTGILVILGFIRRGWREGAPAALMWAIILSATAGLLLISAPDTPAEAATRVLILIITLAVVLGAFVIAEGMLTQQCRYPQMFRNPDALAEPVRYWNGFPVACGAVGMLLLMGIALQLVRPARWDWGGYSLPAALTTISGFAGAIALLWCVHRQMHTGVGDLGLALFTLLALSAGFLVLLPRDPDGLAARMPLRLNALAIGIAAMVIYWQWLHGIWTQQLDNGRAWTTAGKLHARIVRLGFSAGTLGALLLILMAIWPRLDAVGHRDDGFYRMTFGLLGHLALMLATMAAARHWHRRSFYGLTTVAALSLVAFLVIRLADHVEVVHHPLSG